MSVLQYNGIALQVCKVLKCDRHFIYDGPTYLYTKWILSLRCLYNPFATSYDIAGVGGNVFSTPRVAAMTDATIKHRLGVPRKQLIVGSGGIAFLVSPQAGFTVDSANGPQPLACNVVKIAGTKSFLVDYAIQTSLRDCSLETLTYPSIFLSHRWSMEHELDDDFFTTRTIRGHVIFDAARMQQVPVVADQYRGALFHPIPPNCQRHIPLVRQHEDGNSVEYIVKDVEQAVNLGSAALFENVTRIEATHEAEVSGPGLAQVGGQAIRTGVNIVRRGIESAFLGKGATAIAVGAVGGAIEGIVDAVGNLIPIETHTIGVRVSGNGDSSKRGLVKVGQQIIADRVNKMAIVMPGITLYSWGSRIVIELHKRAVEVKQTIRFVPFVTTNVSVIAIVAGVSPVQYPVIPTNGTVPNYLIPGNNGTNALPPGDGISRGTLLEVLTAQALSDPCSNQITPVLASGINPNSTLIQDDFSLHTTPLG